MFAKGAGTVVDPTVSAPLFLVSGLTGAGGNTRGVVAKTKRVRGIPTRRTVSRTLSALTFVAVTSKAIESFDPFLFAHRVYFLLHP